MLIARFIVTTLGLPKESGYDLGCVAEVQSGRLSGFVLVEGGGSEREASVV